MRPTTKLALCVVALGTACVGLAEELLTTEDGLTLFGTVQLLQGNAATCNVVEANEPNYEQKRFNQGRPLHLWVLEFSVFNGSGRALDHLIAHYSVESPWPPCTNWTDRYDLEGEYAGKMVQWVDPSGHVQRSGAATPTLPNETHAETILLLAFDGVKPKFAKWSVNYTFLKDGAGEPQETRTLSEHAVTQPLSDTGGPTDARGLPAAVVAEGICGDASEDQPCWLELANRTGCFIWQSLPPASDVSVTWSGACLDGFANGVGDEVTNDAEELADSGAMTKGKRNGRWIKKGKFKPNDVDEIYTYEGEYHEGLQEGLWVGRATNGVTAETPFVRGERHGTEVLRYADGDVRETPYVRGEIHGTEVWRSTDGNVRETPYVRGEIHGTEVDRYANGTVHETPYVRGEIHGTQVLRWADGEVNETPYVRGDRPAGAQPDAGA